MCREDVNIFETFESTACIDTSKISSKERKLMDKFIKRHINNIPESTEQRARYLWTVGGRRWLMLAEAILIAIAHIVVIVSFLITIAVLLNVTRDDPRLISQSIVVFVSFAIIMKVVNTASISYLNKLNLEYDVVNALVQYYDQLKALENLAEKLEEAKKYAIIVARLKSAQRITATKF